MAMWILLEEEADLQEMMLEMVEVLGSEGVAFSDGPAALKWIDQVDSGHYTGNIPELALLDMRLPLANSGPGVAARLRSCHRLKDIVIVLMTTYRLSFDEQESIMQEAGADFLLYKPLPSIDELEYIFHGLLLSR